jgi:putative membrane protein
MVSARALFTAEDRKAISKAVAEAEKGTAGEIVPVVATTSDRYDRAEDTFGLWLGMLAMAAVWVAFQGVRIREDDWEVHWELALTLVPLVGILTLGWIVGIRLAHRFPALKRLAALRRELRSRVEQRAAMCFDLFRVGKTRDATGIVLYVSLFERMVCVRADPAVSEKVDPSEWKDICEGMMAALREGRHREAFVQAIARCGEVLGKHYPIKPDDTNELPNDLRILD